MHREIIVFVVVRKQRVDCAIVPAQQIHRVFACGEFFEIARNLLQRPAAIDSKKDLTLVESAMPPDPQFTIDAIGEELGFSAVVFGDEEERAMRSAFRLEHQESSGFARAHQVCKVACRPEPKVCIVGARVFLTGRNHEVAARKFPRKLVAA